MSPLERHCQLLLRAYPAGYREVRGEEIVGTLLEATPPERSWPWPRDSRGLIVGGLRARAALNRQLTIGANLRIAVLAGIAAYVVFNASAFLSPYVGSGVIPGRPSVPLGGPFAAVVLPLIPVMLVWLGRRRRVVMAGGLPAAAAICYAGFVDGAPGGGLAVGLVIGGLVCLAALVGLGGYAERPGWRWFWPVGMLALASLLPITPQLGNLTSLLGGVNLVGLLLLALVPLSIVWIVVDGRPAIAMAVFLAEIKFQAIGFLATGLGFQDQLWALMIVAAIAAIAALATWRLRRQSAHPGRPTRA